MRVSKTMKIVLAVGLVVLAPAVAFADPVFIITYGGWAAMEKAVNILQWVTADRQYNGLFASFAVLGILLAGARNYFQLITSKGGNPSVLAWLWPSVIGVVIFLAFVVPKQEIVIHDESLNRDSEIMKIPKLLATGLSITSTIEAGILKIIENTQIDRTLVYREAASGVGYNLLREKFQFSPDFRNLLSAYVQECVMFEMARPGGTITAAMLSRGEGIDGGGGIMEVLAKAQNPAIFVSPSLQTSEAVYSHPAFSDGFSDSAAGTTHDEPVNCTQAFGMLQHGGVSGEDEFKALCMKSGFVGAGGVVNTQTCEDSISKTLAATGNPNAAARGGRAFLVQQGLATMVYELGKSGSDSDIARTTANRSIISSGLSTMVVDGDWLIIGMYCLQAIAIATAPFLLLFCVTPLWPKVLSFIAAGVFVWPIVARICDATIWTLVNGIAAEKFAEINALGPDGMAAALMYPDVAMRTLTFMAQARGGGMLLATAITSALGLASSYAMTQLAGSLSGAVQSAANQGGASAYSPEGRASQLAGSLQAQNTMHNAHKFTQGAQVGAMDNASAHHQAGYNRDMNNMEALGRGDFADKGLPAGTDFYGAANASSSLTGSEGTLNISRAGGTGAIVNSALTSGSSISLGNKEGNASLGDNLGKLYSLSNSQSRTTSDSKTAGKTLSVDDTHSVTDNKGVNGADTKGQAHTTTFGKTSSGATTASTSDTTSTGHNKGTSYTGQETTGQGSNKATGTENRTTDTFTAKAGVSADAKAGAGGAGGGVPSAGVGVNGGIDGARSSATSTTLSNGNSVTTGGTGTKATSDGTTTGRTISGGTGTSHSEGRNTGEAGSISTGGSLTSSAGHNAVTGQGATSGQQAGESFADIMNHGSQSGQNLIPQLSNRMVGELGEMGAAHLVQNALNGDAGAMEQINGFARDVVSGSAHPEAAGVATGQGAVGGLFDQRSASTNGEVGTGGATAMFGSGAGSAASADRGSNISQGMGTGGGGNNTKAQSQLLAAGTRSQRGTAVPQERAHNAADRSFEVQEQNNNMPFGLSTVATILGGEPLKNNLANWIKK